MARTARKTGKKATKRAKGGDEMSRPEAVTEQVAASIVVHGQEDAPQYYCNHVEVSHNPHEFEIVCARVPTKISPENIDLVKKEGRIEVEALACVIIPPTLIPDIIRVFVAQKEKYESMYSELHRKIAKDES